MQRWRPAGATGHRRADAPGAGTATIPPGGTSLIATLGYWINTSIMLGLWCAAWIVWRALRHARESRAARLQAEAERRQIEHDALRARLNPHFVFNALNNLRALILEDPQRARELVGRLSNTLRHANTATAIPCRWANWQIEDYLAVEAVHFEDRLRIRRDIEPAATEARCRRWRCSCWWKIKHGIAVTPGGGIRSWRTKGCCTFASRIPAPGPGRWTRVGCYLRHVLARVNGRFALEHGDRVRPLEVPQ